MNYLVRAKFTVTYEVEVAAQSETEAIFMAGKEFEAGGVLDGLTEYCSADFGAYSVEVLPEKVSA